MVETWTLIPVECAMTLKCLETLPACPKSLSPGKLKIHMLPLKWFFEKHFGLCKNQDRLCQPQAFTFQERRSASIGSGIVRSRPGLSPAEILRRRGTMQNNFITIIIFRSKRQIYFVVIFLFAVVVAGVHSFICSFSNFTPIGLGWQGGSKKVKIWSRMGLA